MCIFKIICIFVLLFVFLFYFNLNSMEENIMAQYRCLICGYVYDEDKGEEKKDVAPGTAFEDLPEDFKCPLCGAAKSMIKKI